MKLTLKMNKILINSLIYIALGILSKFKYKDYEESIKVQLKNIYKEI